MLKVTIVCLIYRSARFAEWVYDSARAYTPMIERGECDFLFVANDATEGVKSFLKEKSYPHVINDNEYLSQEELFDRGYGKPEYIHRVYRGWNAGIKASKTDLVVLVNSDNYFSPDWLEGLLKHYSSNRVVCSQLVERQHPRYPVFPGAIHGEFGNHPDNFDRQGFLRLAEGIRTTGVRPGGAFMPCLVSRSAIESVGMYPEGNLAGISFDHIVGYGDEVLFRRLRRRGIEQVTSLDSVVYHLKEGEMDDTRTGESVAAPRLRPYCGARTEVAATSKVGIVVTPTQQPIQLELTLESVLGQRYPNWEISVLDSGNSAAITELMSRMSARFARRSARIYSGCGDFPGAVVNEVFQSPGVDYLAVVSGSALLKPRYLEQAVSALQKDSSLNLVYSAGSEYGESFEPLPSGQFSEESLLRENVFPSVFVLRRDLWDSVGGLRPFLPLDLAFHDFYIRALPHQLQPRQIDEVLYLLGVYGRTSPGLDSRQPLGRALLVSLNPDLYKCEEVLAAHEVIADAPPAMYSVLNHLAVMFPNEGVLPLWLGLLEEKRGNKSAALRLFRSIKISQGSITWQALARLLILESEQELWGDVRKTAQALVQVKPDLPWARDIISRLEL